MRAAARVRLASIVIVVAALCSSGLMASTAVAQTRVLGLPGWEVQSSAEATQSGEELSSPSFAGGSWLAVKPDDAGAPGTEIGALLQNGACPEVFFAENMKTLFRLPGTRSAR